MDIISYLLILIETRKTVGIAGLGTLYKKKIPGRYDAKLHSFLPPSYELAFTATLREQEELVNYICEQRNLTNESAQYYINEFVENIQAQLADQQKVDLNPIGELKIVNDELVLVPSTSINIGADFYGLPVVAVDTETIITAENESNQVENIAQIPVNEDPVSENFEIESATVENTTTINDQQKNSVPDWATNYDDDDDDDDRRPGRGLRIFLRVLLVLFLIAAAAAVTYFISPELFNTTKHSYEDVESAAVPPINIDTTKLDSTSTPTADTIALTTAKKDILIDTTTVYEVIESAMKSHKKVDEIIANMAKRGIKAKKIEPIAGRLIKISVGTFTDYNLAKKYQDSLRLKLKNPEIYIQTIKPRK